MQGFVSKEIGTVYRQDQINGPEGWSLAEESASFFIGCADFWHFLDGPADLAAFVRFLGGIPGDGRGGTDGRAILWAFFLVGV
jgi:hypothetical protein